MNTSPLSHKVLGIILSLAVITPIAAVAQRPATNNGIDSPPRVVVKYGDLDLSRSKDAALLLTRVHAAAKTACAQFDGKDLSLVALFRTCVEHAIDGAVQQIDQPTLTALYDANTGKKLPTALMLSANH